MNISTTTILITIGALYLLYLSTKLLKFIHLHFLRRSSITRYLHNHHNTSAPPWAVITGSSDGIGLAYAYLLANRGFNIVLHGRNSTKLHHVRHELQNEFPHLQFKILILDATKSGTESLKEIEEAVGILRELHVTVLINNVGTGTKGDGSPILEPFVETSAKNIDDLLNTNARFPVQFTRAVLPHLLSHGGPALILTMGSMAELGMPYIAAYACYKSLDLAFSKALRRDLIAEGRENVEVLGIMVASVTETGWDKSKRDVTKPTSGEFARKVMDMVGCGEEVVAPWWSHAVAWWVLRGLPTWVVDRMIISEAKKTREEFKKRF